MKETINEQQLQQRIDDLSAEIQPQRDLWQGIERAIEIKSQVQPASEPRASNGNIVRANFQPLAWAASIVLAVILTFNYQSRPEQAPQLTAVEMIEQQYLQEKQNMLVSFGKPNLDTLPDDIRQQFDEIQSARESLLTALEDDPQNADLLNLLKWTQKQELNLLEQLYSPKWQTI
ncbi:anti-sigma factor [Thalassotalea litorea]|uniref:Anti-sigma factor n=1 Tax=Thalassotalea litorea TaxID=2020715 RepID=A0A5R9IFI1_9GAMM|nr:anti-sigma factor [Thalassotalea litorea]TLU64295.1 anti-sigma factor [Thalassotalea litorea]